MRCSLRSTSPGSNRLAAADSDRTGGSSSPFAGGNRRLPALDLFSWRTHPGGCGRRRKRGRKFMLLTYMRVRLSREEGQALVEYALIVSLIAIVCVAALTFAGEQIDNIISEIGSSL